MRMVMTICFLGLSACGYYNEASHVPTPGTVRLGVGQSPGYEVVAAILGRNRCLECHTAAAGNRGGVNLESYGAAKALAARVYATTSGGSMPMGGPRVAADDVATLKAWMDAGAPEVGGPAAGPAPTPDRPAELDFAAVKSAIFTPYCVGCHSRFNEYARVAANLPGIQRAIDTNFMPRGGPPLNAELKTLLANWIAAGAPEGNGRGSCDDDDCDD